MSTNAVNTVDSASPIGAPLWLLAEVTYKCPLHCVFCYNPVDFAQSGPELSTEDWLRVLREARAAGSVQCGFSGGEPLLREDLEVLVTEDMVGHRLGEFSETKTFRKHGGKMQKEMEQKKKEAEIAAAQSAKTAVADAGAAKKK